ncbi:MAG: diguanylate cyclase [Rhodospirillales bacterium]|nr:diguanylate cyclase [Rhodospirillales bacterium]
MQFHDEKILIVEDSKFNAQILSKAVSPLAQVCIATTGTQALQMMTEDDFGVVLLDIMLPDIDGFEICRRIVESNKLLSPAIIFVTSKDEIEDEEKGLSLGAVDYLYKPIVASLVRVRVSNHLQLRRAHKELLSLNEELTRLSSTDPLTNVSNRRYFFETMEKEIGRAKRYNHDYALMALDLDHFKLVNDRFGHDRGDAVLIGVANAWIDVLRTHDVLGRTGGEEFLIFLPHTDKSKAQVVAGRLLEATRQLKIPDGKDGTLEITVSIGIAMPDSNCSKSLTICADKALYQAKAEGRNRAVCNTQAPECCEATP